MNDEKMGFYENIYDCGDGDYCVDCGSSLDGFASSWIMRTCKKHKLVKGVKLDLNITVFINTFRKIHPELEAARARCAGDIDYADLYNIGQTLVTIPVEFVEKRQTPVRGGSLEVVQLLASGTDLDVSLLDDQKKLFFSAFDDAPSWEVLPDERVRLTLLFDMSMVRFGPLYCGREVWWNWEKNALFKGNEKLS